MLYPSVAPELLMFLSIVPKLLKSNLLKLIFLLGWVYPRDWAGMGDRGMAETHVVFGVEVKS